MPKSQAGGTELCHSYCVKLISNAAQTQMAWGWPSRSVLCGAAPRYCAAILFDKIKRLNYDFKLVVEHRTFTSPPAPLLRGEGS